MQSEQTNNPLSSFEGKAINAHYWTSFSPERRGKQLIEDYGGELTEDIEELKTKGISEEIIGEYTERYKRYFSSYLSAKGNTFSAMITGPAKFNTRKHEKANRSEQRHYEVFREWRVRAKKAIIRKAAPKKTFLSEIDRYKNELEGMKKNHALMKEGNKRIAQSRKTGEDITQYLKETFGIESHMIDWHLKFGFGLANNNANMKRVEARIKEMEAKEQRSIKTGEQVFSFEGFTVTYNHEADRIQVKHATKPEYAVISEFKRNGFKWSPSFMAWQRQLNVNGIWATERMLKIKLPSLNQ